ncbi:hypothetical protein [Microbulbifer sp. GL-2]|uniref:hypothetical protein n=1 Tax=Microbulbifer sp. GL-2 TaxID=2591606 RepID=UPI00116521CD|nr:hypothetical protein [Microbulbifer sp. GL-2]BBM04132.1 hypothetical protein GL2_42060 [Microbulbifer sp. GL-2]
MTEDQKIKKGIQYIINTYPPIIDYYEWKNKPNTIVKRNRPPDPVYYKSIEQFQSINMNCCSLSDTGKQGYKPHWHEKLIGRFNTFVHIPYLVRYRDKNNDLIVSETESFVALTNCGTPWSGI